MKLEVCVDSLKSARIAQTAGAFRLELCNGLSEGGVTPFYSLIQFVRELDIRLNVLIRPRGGDFHYSAEEFEMMEEDIRICGKLHCDGVVIGALNTDGTIDKKNCQKLIETARTYSMSITFHRAFDRTENLFQALEDVIGLGCDRILTSGGYESAIEGKDIIYQLAEQAGNRIIIMPGAGITPENISLFSGEKKLKEIHGTFRSRYSGKMKYLNNHFVDQQEEYSGLYADSEKIKKVLALIHT